MLFSKNGGHVQVGKVTWGLALLASTGGFIFGFDTGQISDILLMPDFLERFGLQRSDGSHYFSNVREGLIVAMLSIGTLLGALMGAPFADALGRRRAMTLYCMVFSVGVVIQVTSYNAWYQLMIGRIVAGLGVGALSAAVPAYQSETAPKEIRGTLVSTYQLFITFGILVSYCLCLGTRYIGGRYNTGSLASAQWRLPIALGIVFALILGIGILSMPESPRWLMSHGRPEEAAKALARIRGLHGQLDHPIVQQDYAEIERSVEEQNARDAQRQSSSFGSAWLECFKPERKVLYRTFLGMTLQMFQQLTGANYFFYYGATVFKSVGISDSYITQIILGAINFGCTFGGLYVMERFGRRMPLIIGGIWQSLWLFVYASVGVSKDTSTKSTGTILIVSASLFILGYAMTWGPGVWILIGETFPTRTRAKQAALSTASNWFWNFMLAFFTPFITQDIGFGYGYVFAGCNLAAAIMVFFFLYESSGLSLEAVDMMYNDPNCKPWTSSKWSPPGYTSRYELEKTIDTLDDFQSLNPNRRGDEKKSGGLQHSINQRRDNVNDEGEKRNENIELPSSDKSHDQIRASQDTF